MKKEKFLLLLIFPISLLSCSSKVKEISFESFNETYSSFEYDNYH